MRWAGIALNYSWLSQSRNEINRCDRNVSEPSRQIQKYATKILLWNSGKAAKSSRGVSYLLEKWHSDVILVTCSENQTLELGLDKEFDLHGINTSSHSKVGPDMSKDTEKKNKKSKIATRPQNAKLLTRRSKSIVWMLFKYMVQAKNAAALKSKK